MQLMTLCIISFELIYLRKLDLSHGVAPSNRAYTTSYERATSPNSNRIVGPLILLKVSSPLYVSTHSYLNNILLLQKKPANTCRCVRGSVSTWIILKD